MSGSHDLAARFALLKLLLGELGSAKTAADEQIRGEWVIGDRNSARLPDGPVVASVTLNKGRTLAHISDGPVFEDWVKANHPDQIIEVTQTYVDPGYIARLLSAARKLGEAVDAETGEIVPGVEVGTGEPYPSVRLADDARNHIAKAWADGSLAELVSGLLAIEGGEES